MCGIQKDGIDDLIYKAEIETQKQRTDMDTKEGRGIERNWEADIDTYTLLILRIKQVANDSILQS